MSDASPPTPDPHRAALRRLHRASDEAVLGPLLALATLAPADAARVRARAVSLVEAARRAHRPGADVSAFLAEFGLGTREGVALLCLAEALLRIPDAATADRLIEDKLAGADWQSHLGHADSLLVNASSFAFMLTGRVLSPAADGPMLSRTVRRLGEPVIRAALRQGMKVLAGQFVMGRTIAEALKRSAESAEARRARYSFDMLGEAARTEADAARYMASYSEAIGAVGAASAGRGPVEGPGVSVKLSALHPRYEPTKPGCVPALIEALAALARKAKEGNIGLTVDAEEADRLDLSLDIIAAVHGDPALAGWQGLGMAVQAYQKRCLPLIDWAAALAVRNGRALPVRLVKGAYWDSEIKHAQVHGRADYPVFTRKAATDVSWLACARRMLESAPHIQPAFATHNATSLAFILETAAGRPFEMQRLHGMGEALYAGAGCAVRVYAPVGGHEDLLAYLVRRLLENGANTGFVHRLTDPAVPAEALAEDPVAALTGRPVRNARIPLPRDLYGGWRNSAGLDLGDPLEGPPALEAIRAAAARRTEASPIIGGRERSGARSDVRDPADIRRVIGTVAWADHALVDEAARLASRAWRGWNDAGAEHRAATLERAADLIEANREDFLALIAREAGRTLADGIAEVREAADFCRYYAAEARRWFAPRELPGPTGERNTWSLSGRGVIAAISPWNFPLAIFVGQVAAALAAGNAVLAKPAEQTPLVAARAVALLHQAGVPPDVLAYLPGDGPSVGSALVTHPAVSGVAFTGGTDTARAIAAIIATRPGLPIPLVAETGGVNAMIVDSSALPEQVTADVLDGAFRSAGQRCSALRLLCLQAETADRVLGMIEGAARTLTIGDPLDPATDIGPVIDAAARDALAAWAPVGGVPLFTLPLPEGCAHGTFFAPRAILLPSARALGREVFGPVLHVVRWRDAGLEALLDDIAASGFALTLGVHSRVEATAARITARLSVGNAYINRGQIGAVPGVQPFGGHGLSGTGPKAGGPLTLLRFATEHVVSVNTAAAGGNAALLATDEAGARRPLARALSRAYRDRACRETDARVTSPTLAAGAPPRATTNLAIILSLSFCHLLNDTMQSLLPALYPILKDQFSLDFTQIGLLTLAFQVTASLLQPAVGLYTDRNPMPYSMAAGMGATLTGLVLLATADTYPLLVLAAMLVGCGSAVFHPEASRVARAAAGGRYGFAQSLFQVGGNTGSAIGPLLAAFVVVPAGQGRVMWFSGAALLASVVLARVGAWYAKARRAPGRAAAQANVPLPRATVTLGLIVLVVLLFSKNFYSAALTSYFTFYLIKTFGVSVQTAQLFLFAHLAGLACGILVGGWVGDRVGRIPVIWFSILGALPFTLALPFANLFWTGVLAVVIGLITASAFSAILVYAQDLLPGRVGFVSGLFFGFSFGLGGLGAAALGTLADATSITFVYRLVAFLPLLGLATALLPRVGGVQPGARSA